MKALRLNEQHNGVYRLPQDPVAADAVLRQLAVDLRRATGKQAVLRVLARALAAPATFGGNWDALNDALQDLSWLPAQGIVLTLSGSGAFAAAAADDFALLCEILDSAAAYWRGRGRVFVAFCDAPGLPEFPRP
jgi:hypothetical protein